jgi:TatD DNase family protein
MPLTDAHCHLQEAELAEMLPAWWSLAETLGIHRWLVNGLHEGDWHMVTELAHEHSGVIPSYGLHPWYVKDRSEHWLHTLREILVSRERVGVGEIGLDKWVKDHDFPDQLRVFRPQLALAAEHNLPTSIHCIQAWGALWDELRTSQLPARGFLIHAYGGPIEMVSGLVKLGAYFSFSPYFLHERKALQRTVFQQIPLDRLLIETDAPALWPPPEYNRFPLTDPNGHPANHPGNLVVSVAGLADLRGLPELELAAILEDNFDRWIS